jgi:hypothetical protein
MQTEKKQHPKNPYWAWGEIKALSQESGVCERAIHFILHRARRSSFNIANKLEKATIRMRRPIDRDIWLNNLTTDHPAFRVKDEFEKEHVPDRHLVTRRDFMSVNIDKISEKSETKAG